ncbi:hypothetical protein H257_12853 [Aphanomyces astaci]|uniref:HECT-type E3 ubiquitin transferase n=1 Tax=Aphanomyces astaci TaxID=112090 RepID=W4FX31_APHAT|nr:hypothetical protein H257_12853 [Aphanomyces astaci]ETV72060.1 hypothetical protein H257_12853 [Aphanomyces astaci]|eukprot:XP_009838503.1 hypothetical protein H257_12853 [Aphanomyces astaci]
MDANHYGAYQLYVVSGLTLLVSYVSILCRSQLQEATIRAVRQALLPNASAGHLDGLTRGDLEDVGLEATKWKCGVCAFYNPDETDACVLCDTSRAMFLLAAPEFGDCENTIPIENLNLKQRAAWQRKQWTRDIDAVGEAYWNNAPGIPPTPSAIIYLVHSTRSSYASTAALALSPLTAASASKTLLGDPIASWWLPNLKTLRSYNFSIKYAWLLEQLSLVYTGHTKIEVRRATLMPMSLKLLGEIKPDNLCTKTKVTLLGESAVDAGGVSREWYTLVTMAIFETKEGLFMVANKDDQSFFINPNSERDHGPNHLADFQAVGRLLGRAIIDGQVLPFHFCVPLFKMLLGYPVSIEDVRYLDLTVYSNLTYIRDCDDVDDLALTFSVSVDTDVPEVELVVGGRDVGVTNANKTEYVERMVQYLMFERVAPQLQRLVQGLYDVLPQELLMPFDYKELELILCGFSEIDTLEDVVGWFWEVVEFDMTPSDRAKLLQFTTGSSRVPLQGFKGLTSYDGRLCPFNLYGIPYHVGAFPRGHSCFNRIDLPIYPSRELMKDALFALVAMESLEFTIV